MRARFVWRPKPFLRDEEGSVTVEAVLWLPVFFAVLVLITDVSFAFFGKAQALRIMQDGNRAYSLGRFDTTLETQTQIKAAFRGYSPNARVSTVEGGGVVSTTMVIPASDLMLFDSLARITNFNITVQAQHLIE